MRESKSSLTNNNTKYTEMALKTSIDTKNTKKALNLKTNIATWTVIDLAFIYRAAAWKRDMRRQAEMLIYTNQICIKMFFSTP